MLAEMRAVFDRYPHISRTVFRGYTAGHQRQVQRGGYEPAHTADLVPSLPLLSQMEKNAILGGQNLPPAGLMAFIFRRVFARGQRVPWVHCGQQWWRMSL